MERCPWGQGDELYTHYHDTEWGRPTTDDNRLFEKICLEGFQSGLSWLTILRKRENFRAAFAGFDPEIVATYDEKKVEELLQDAGIVRHRGKIEATINNAKMVLELREEFPSFANYVWRFEPKADDRPTDFSWESLSKFTTSEAAKALSKDLKKRGFKFVGPTTAYAFMQAMGLVNDHVENCFCRKQCDEERAALTLP